MHNQVEIFFAYVLDLVVLYYLQKLWKEDILLNIFKDLTRKKLKHLTRKKLKQLVDWLY